MCLLGLILFVVSGSDVADSPRAGAITLEERVADLEESADVSCRHICASLSNVDPKFVGVLAFAEVLSSPRQCEGAVASLTDSSGVYWRARLEMAPADPSVLLGRAMLHFRCGEIGQGDAVLDLAEFMITPEFGARTGFLEFAKDLIAYSEARDSLLASGIAAFDAGNAVRADSLFNRVLAADSTCARAWHEHFLTESARSGAIHPQEYEFRVYGSDPLFPLGMFAQTGTEAFRIGRRIEIPALMKDPEAYRADLLALATIALDVESFGMGAEYFWTAALANSDEQRTQALDGFLYCLHRLGVTGIQENFRGDQAERIRRVEQAHLQRVHDSLMYQSMKVKD
jgi:hypothetical protein